jgi:hypothetical protein
MLQICYDNKLRYRNNYAFVTISAALLLLTAYIRKTFFRIMDILGRKPDSSLLPAMYHLLYVIFVNRIPFSHTFLNFSKLSFFYSNLETICTTVFRHLMIIVSYLAVSELKPKMSLL